MIIISRFCLDLFGTIAYYLSKSFNSSSVCKIIYNIFNIPKNNHNMIIIMNYSKHNNNPDLGLLL